MAVLKSDELNKLSKPKQRKRQSMDYEDYFGEMVLDKVDKEERISLANKFEEIFYAILLVLASTDFVKTDLTRLYDKLQRQIEYVVNEYDDTLLNNTVMANHCRELSWDVIDATVRHKDDAYYFSLDRAMLIAENEANTFGNAKQYNDAISGRMKQKTWFSMHDQRVRESHQEADGQTVPIEELFEIGDSLMAYPRDLTYDPNPSEVVGCRCSCLYS